MLFTIMICFFQNNKLFLAVKSWGNLNQNFFFGLIKNNKFSKLFL